jgi:hypothetical protein
MDPRRGHGFGWTTPCPVDGRELSERHVDALWTAYFPEADGYVWDRRELPEGLRLMATRGDFHAEVEVAGGTRRGAPRLRLCGAAGSHRMAATELRTTTCVERMRVLGGLVGAGFVAFIGSRLLVYPPVITIDALTILGGLLLVVMLIVLVLTGSGLGGYFGEVRAAGLWAATLDAVGSDDKLRADLLRWRALVRTLSHHRDALAGGARGLPFRSEG